MKLLIKTLFFMITLSIINIAHAEDTLNGHYILSVDKSVAYGLEQAPENFVEEDARKQLNLLTDRMSLSLNQDALSFKMNQKTEIIRFSSYVETEEGAIATASMRDDTFEIIITKKGDGYIQMTLPFGDMNNFIWQKTDAPLKIKQETGAGIAADIMEEPSD